MKLDRYLAKCSLSKAAFSRLVGVEPATIQRLILTGKQARTASLTLALRVEAASFGKVKAEELPLTDDTRKTLAILRKMAADMAQGIRPESGDPRCSPVPSGALQSPGLGTPDLAAGSAPRGLGRGCAQGGPGSAHSDP